MRLDTVRCGEQVEGVRRLVNGDGKEGRGREAKVYLKLV